MVNRPLSAALIVGLLLVPTLAPAQRVATAQAQRTRATAMAATSVGPPAGYRPFTSTRMLDTRATGGRLNAGGIATINASALLAKQGFTGWTAVSANVTAADPTAPGYLTVWPCDHPQPDTSTVNFTGGGASSTHAIVTLSASSTFCVFASQGTDLIVDLFGGFLSMDNPIKPSRLHIITPQRIYDSRSTPGLIPSGSITRIKVPSGLLPGGTLRASSTSPLYLRRTLATSRLSRASPA